MLKLKLCLHLYSYFFWGIFSLLTTVNTRLSKPERRCTISFDSLEQVILF